MEDGVVSLILASTAGEVIVWIVWVVAGLALLASGFAVILFSNPFYSALALIANLGSLAVLYLLLSAEFVAAAQVLVYAGAVMVMFLFVIAYIGDRADEPFAGRRSLARVAAVVAATALLVEIVVVVVAGRRRATLDLGGDRRLLRQPESDRHALPHRLPARVRGDVDHPARRCRRGRRARVGRAAEVRDDDEESGAATVGQPPPPEAA